MKEKQHILFICSWYKTSPEGTKGSFFEEQARMFLKRGHQVGVLSTQLKLKFLQKYRDRTLSETKNWNDDGIPTYYNISHSVTPKNPHPSKLDLNLFLKRGYKKYKEYKSRYGKPDLLHAQTTIWGGILANYISKKENIPYFVTEHFTELILNQKYCSSDFIYKELIEKTINHSTQSFAVSSFFSNQLKELYNISNAKLKVLHNIISNNLVREIPKRTTSIQDPFKLLIIGSLIERKNHFTLFKAIRLLLEKGQRITLNVIGEGKLKHDLVQFIKENNLGQNICLLGNKSREEVAHHILESDCVVSASTFETFGMSIIEAHALGKPVIALDSGGPRDTVTNENGILIKKNEVNSFYTAIQFMINNYDNFNQKEISSQCIKMFGEQKIYNVLTRIYSGKSQME